MKILALETSADPSSLALWEDQTLLAEDAFNSKMVLCEQLAPRILAITGVERLVEAGLGGIAISIGPGSFTGLRVGLATAKALAHCLELPIVGVSTALAIAAEAKLSPGILAWVLQPSRKGEKYLSRFTVDAAGMPSPLGPPELIAADSAQTEAAAAGAVVIEAGPPRAGTIASLGAKRFGGAGGDERLTLRPVYVGKSQAEVNFGVDLGMDGTR